MASTSNGWNLKSKKRIVERVSELTIERLKQFAEANERAVKALAIDRETILRGLLEERALASERGQHGSAIRALELLGKELGMFIDRKETTNRYESMGDQEIDAELARINALLAGPGAIN
jgi:hypothetical protein